MFPEEMFRPFREELTNIGFRELRTPAQVDAVLKNEKGTVLVVVNSVCGCAAGYAPSSPSIALLHDGKMQFMMERHQIESRDARAIAEDLTRAFQQFCAPANTAKTSA